MIDASAIGTVAVKLVESLEEDYPDATMTRCAVAIQVEYINDDGDKTWGVRWRGDDDPIATLGVMEGVVFGLKAQSQ